MTDPQKTPLIYKVLKSEVHPAGFYKKYDWHIVVDAPFQIGDPIGLQFEDGDPIFLKIDMVTQTEIDGKLYLEIIIKEKNDDFSKELKAGVIYLMVFRDSYYD